MTLITAVTNILCKRVTEKEAQEFALNQYGVLATYIRQEFIKSLKTKNDAKFPQKNRKNSY